MENQLASPVPGSYWVTATLGLLWNGFGAYLYTLANLGDPSVTAGASPAMVDYIARMPVWAHAGWAVGIWGSLAGSLLMLARSRHAVTAFVVSALGALVSYAAQAMAGVLTLAQPVVILAVIAFQWWYCRRAVVLGFLR